MLISTLAGEASREVPYCCHRGYAWQDRGGPPSSVVGIVPADAAPYGVDVEAEDVWSDGGVSSGTAELGSAFDDDDAEEFETSSLEVVVAVASLSGTVVA